MSDAMNVDELTEAQKAALEEARKLFKASSVIPARRFIDAEGRLMYSKVKAETTQDLSEAEADCFLVQAFAVVESTSVRDYLMKEMK
ncbi:MAG: hypothetical protein ACRCVX_12560 [Shewanella sp.]